MCFIVERDLDTKQIAKEDIICYKYLYFNLENNSYSSPHKGYKYIIETIQPDVKLNIKDIYIKEGYHSYISIEKLYKNVSMSYKDRILCEFIIPKNSEYYVNNKCYVSSNIIFKKVIEKDLEEWYKIYTEI